MEVILVKDVQGLGYKNDTVKVKPGYGRNYLIPQGLAIVANNANSKKVTEEIRQAAHKADKIKKDAEAIAEKMQGVKLEIGAKVGESGKIFGAITTLQIADALKAKGIEIDRRQISFPKDVKQVGEHIALIDLHKEVKQEVEFSVVSE